MIFVTWFAAIAFFLTIGTFVVDFIISAPTTTGPKSDHFDGKRFSNPNNTKARGFKDIIKWSLSGDPGVWKEIPNEEVTFGTPVPSVDEIDKIAITFVNHATFLIQTDGLNILTDPIWSERASPFQWIGPKRMRPPGIRFEDLPHIDLVLISHNHYDHLDINTVLNLNETYEPLFILPLGVSNFLKENGIYNTVELDWWQQYEVDHELKISSVPAQHFSGRGLTDRDKTLWCGYVVQLPKGNFYYAGDTGYDGFFTEIGKRFAPIHTALIPIGAFRPRWFMRPIHVDPEEAVLIHKDIQAKTSIGMHFGTFPLADDGMNEPVELLAEARAKHSIAEDEFQVLREGETRFLQFLKKQNVGHQ